jgi:hypothetical protein
MPCDHTGPHEIIEMAEARLRAMNVPESLWPGARARHGENQPDGAMWASVVIEIERRGDEWIVTRLDRNHEPLAESETGLELTTLHS